MTTSNNDNELLRKSIAEKELLLSLSSDIAQIKARKELMQLIREKFQQFFYFYHCTIALSDKEKTTLKAFLLDPNSKMRLHKDYQEMITHHYPFADGLHDKVEQSDKPEIFDLDTIVATGKAPHYAVIMNQSGIKQLMGVALKTEGKTIGVLVFHSDKADNFNPSMFETVSGIVGQISLTVSNLLAAEAIDAKIKERETLLHLSEVISRVKDRNELLALVNTELKQLFVYSHSLVLLYNSDLESMCTYILDPESKNLGYKEYEKLTTQPLPVKDGILDTILLSEAPLVFDVDAEALKTTAPPYMKMHFDNGLKELMAITLRKPTQEPLGMLIFFGTQKGLFNTEVIQLVKGVVNHITTALNNILHLEEIEERNKENRILLSVSHAISSIRNTDNLMSAIRAQLKSVMAFTDICISLYNHEKSNYTIFAYDSELLSRYPDDLLSSAFPLNDGIHNVVIQKDHTVIFSNESLKAMKMPHVDFMLGRGIREIACVRLVSSGQIIGALTLSSEQDYAFSQSDATFIQRLSPHLATAIANIHANEVIQERDRQNEILLSVSTAISATRDKYELVRIIHQSLKRFISFSDVSITTFNIEKGTIKPYLYYCEQVVMQPDYEEVVTQEYPLYDGLHDNTLETENVCVVTVESLLPRKQPNIEFIHRGGIKELAAIRLQNSNEVFGAMVLLSTKNDAFPEADRELIKRLSYHISTGVSNLLANERIENQLKEISSYKSQLEDEKQYLQQEANIGYSYNDIIGSGFEMQKVFHLLSQVAFASSTVLILGETGTGKELIARAIHNYSPRKDKLMVKVNCAAIPVSLIESELFGHERGSFTGATERRIGKFELANKGTLFLDEIGELPLDLQAKLLRVLQEKEIERVGGQSVIKTDVRIIAATNRNLLKEVEEGRFRRDLYYRLDVFPITLPALRDHKEDIPDLAIHFLDKYAKNSGKKVVKIANKVMKELMSYYWPGNVRELEHLIERSVLMATGDTLKEVYLPTPKAVERTNFIKSITFSTYEENEREHIINALNNCKGKIYGPGGAAELLGLKVGTLNSMIARLGIKKGDTVYKWNESPNNETEILR